MIDFTNWLFLISKDYVLKTVFTLQSYEIAPRGLQFPGPIVWFNSAQDPARHPVAKRAR